LVVFQPVLDDFEDLGRLFSFNFLEGSGEEGLDLGLLLVLRNFKPLISQYFWIVLAESQQNRDLFVWNKVLDSEHGVEEGFTRLRFVVLVKELGFQLVYQLLLGQSLVDGLTYFISDELVLVVDPVQVSQVVDKGFRDDRSKAFFHELVGSSLDKGLNQFKHGNISLSIEVVLIHWL